MSGDDHSPTQAPGGTASNFDRFKAAEPARLRRRQLGVRPRDLLRLSQRDDHERAGGRLQRRGLRGRAPSARRGLPDGPDHRGRARRRLRHAARDRSRRSTRASRRPRRAARTASSGPTGSRTQRSSSRAGSGWTRNYYHYPGSWIGTKHGFMTGGGFPMRFADLDGTLIDVYQANTNMTDETTSAFQTAIDALLDNAVGSQGYYGAFGIEHPHRQPRTASRKRSDRRLGSGAQPSRSSRTSSCSTGPTAATARRSAASTGAGARSPLSPRSARAATASRRCCRPRARPGL